MIDRRLLAGALLAAAGTTLAAGAFADTRTGETAAEGHSAGASQPMTFDKLDTNRDGYISESEAQAAPTLAMKRQSLDENGDGRLDRTEFAAFEATGETGAESMGTEKQPMEDASTSDAEADPDY